MRYFTIIITMLAALSSVHAQTSTWEPMNRGLGHTLVYNLAIDPVDSLRMFCGTDAGQVYESVDGGFNWELRSNGLPTTFGGERVSGLYQDPNNREQLLAGYSGRQSEQMLYSSGDGGASWKLITTPAAWKSGGILHLHRTQENPPRIYCGLGWWKGLHRTSDNGLTWKSLLTDAAIQTIGVHPSRLNVMLVGCSGRQTLLRTSNSGGSWAEATTGFGQRNEGTGVRSITFSPRSPDVVYIGVTGAGAGLYRSQNGGLSWTQLNGTGEISEIAVHPQNENLIYISAIRSGVLRSTDGGNTWMAINDGLPTTDVMRVRIAPGYPVCVFAVTLKHGAFRLVDEELKADLFVR
jgi:photosystem II stability/assembly factor-like uncharacterized protein